MVDGRENDCGDVRGVPTRGAASARRVDDWFDTDARGEAVVVPDRAGATLDLAGADEPDRTGAVVPDLTPELLCGAVTVRVRELGPVERSTRPPMTGSPR